jgi:glycosyltransferase involved in cell wall biosynthesis
MTPLRVAFIITGLKTGGAEMMLEKLLVNLSPLVQPWVFSLTGLGEIGPRLLARGIPVEVLGMRPGRPNPAGLARLVHRLVQLKPQVVHTWMYHADLFGGLAARLAGVRSVMWGVRHSNLDPSANRRSTLRIVRLCALCSRWLPARIAFPAARARDVHVRFGYDATRMVVIPNGFDLDRFRADPAARHAVRTELGLPDTTPLVGLIGRFDPQKNHQGFAEAMRRLHAGRIDVHAILAGAGIDADNAVLTGWLRDAGVSQVCHLLGRRDDVPRLMAALDVLVLPSIGEAFPNVVGEALASGVPCAVTDVGDTAEIVGDAGLVVAPGDMQALAHAIESLLTLSPVERETLALRAQQAMRTRFEIAVVARRYEEEYRSLAAAFPRPS